MSYDYDLFVIGAGSGGVRAARMSAANGARVAVAENTYLGGTCVNVGCVPKKLFVYGSHYREDFEDAAAYGWDVEARPVDWPRLRDNKTREIERLNGVYRGLLENAGVTVLWGRAVLEDAHTIRIGEQTVTADKVLIATGSWPSVPEVPGREHAITSNEAFYLDRLPRRAVVVGGGYIAVEFAGIFAGLGVDTTLVYRGPLFLRGFDDEVRGFVRDELVRKGIALRFSCNVEAIEAADGVRHLTLDDGSRLETDLVLYATGRTPNSAGLGLEALGVAMNDRGGIVVDDTYRTSVDNVYAIGDVIDHAQLTPVAIAEGMCIANNLFTTNPTRYVDYSLIPTAVFCQPNIGTVGMTEAEAREAHGDDVDVYGADFRPMKHTLTGREERTLMKLIVRRSDDRVIGAHMVGPEAGEIIQGIAVAMTAGATKAQFDRTIGIHPTAAEEFVTMRQARSNP
ncbi:MAG: glutathione-disulfide reductase [Gammaproteobacteria bacterium]|nr:glutathione-disulfide reductase [Gammaproteobacteria bacterium]|tara:strand:- start:3715 stop:5076 length:1362 start_codon:yes stop_codon:yes gene_type:complete